ncbi:MAG: beta-ketoacyl-[acyl-carrier-protein] synthase family protein [Candidatus Saccharibacteria bacterium]
MQEKRAVITGMGVISPIGSNLDEFLAAIIDGRHGVTQVEGLDTSTYITKFGGEIKGFPENYPRQDIIQGLERCSQLALVAAVEAVERSGINIDNLDPYDVGLVLGGLLGGILVGQEFQSTWLNQGIEYTDPKTLLLFPNYAQGDIINQYFKFRGPKATVANACAAGSAAISQALEWIRLGRAKVVLVGGADPLAPVSFAGFSALQALSSEPCSPFCRSNGLSLGEGAGFFVVEEREFALGRQANILAEIRGYGFTSDAHHLTASDPAGSGAVRSMSAALMDAQLTPADVDYINAHGTGTPTNDSAESRAITTVFSENIHKIPVSSTKSMIGHTLGAAGAVEAVASVLAIVHDLLPPTVNFSESEKEAKGGAKFDFVPNKARKGKVEVALSNSFAFGGNNVSVVFSKPEQNFTTRSVKHKDVVITGIGIMSAAGIGKESFWQALNEGKSCLGEIKGFDISNIKWKIAGEVPELKYQKYMTPDMYRRTDYLTRYGIVATREALQDAGIEINKEISEKVGIIYGTATGQTGTVESFCRGVLKHPGGKGSALLFPNTVACASVGNVSIQFKLKGPTATFVTGGTSSCHALAYAVDAINRGITDTLVVLAADELSEVVTLVHGMLGVLSPDVCRPFDKQRNGFQLGSGACALILESEEKARSRGVDIYARIKGYGMTSEGYKTASISPDGESWAESMRKAVNMSGLEMREIDYISSAASGSIPCDVREVSAIRKAFGAHAEDVLVSSLQSTIGNSGHIAGLGIAAIANSFRNDLIPATVNLQQVDAACQLNHVMGSPIKRRINHALVSSMGFGGNYVSVVVSRPN